MMTHTEIQSTTESPRTPWPDHLIAPGLVLAASKLRALRTESDKELADLIEEQVLPVLNQRDELLAALKRSLSWLSSYQGETAMPVYDQARAAIAKAEGRS